MSESAEVICRCEMVARDSIEEAIAEGNLTVNDIKRRTRAGMGVCQGIFCNAAVAQVLCEYGVLPTNIAPMTSRPPMRILQLDLAASSVAGEEQ